MANDARKLIVKLPKNLWVVSYMLPNLNYYYILWGPDLWEVYNSYIGKLLVIIRLDAIN